MRKAAPVEYVRVCTVHGAGFFYIPGTDTCIRIGGRARFEYQYTQNRIGRDVSGFRAIGRIQVDARTSTAYGTLRTFVRFDIASRSGAYLTSGTAQRYAYSFPALGQDTFGRLQKFVDIDKAFVQFAGITAGRAQSFFDFYATDIEFINANLVGNANTDLFAYTATFGGGFSATVAAENPVYRRQPVFATITPTAFGVGNATFTPLNAGAVALGNAAFSPILLGNAAGGAALVDVAQRSRMPDFVGALRVDQAWGSAQVMGAVHEIALGAPNATPTAGAIVNRGYDRTEYGWAVGGGIKLNLPQIAPGDTLWLQAAYAQGGGGYTGMFNPPGAEVQTSGHTRSVFTQVDAALDQLGNLRLSETYSMNFAFLHYWSPEWRSGIFGSWARINYDTALRGVFGPAGTQGLNSGTFRDYNDFYVGGNIAWSPVRDLDLGVELVYERLEFLGAARTFRVNDPNRPGRTFTVDDNFLVRMRVQRDF